MGTRYQEVIEEESCLPNPTPRPQIFYPMLHLNHHHRLKHRFKRLFILFCLSSRFVLHQSPYFYSSSHVRGYRSIDAYHCTDNHYKNGTTSVIIVDMPNMHGNHYGLAIATFRTFPMARSLSTLRVKLKANFTQFVLSELYEFIEGMCFSISTNKSSSAKPFHKLR